MQLRSSQVTGEARSHARELDWSKSPLGPTTRLVPGAPNDGAIDIRFSFSDCLWSGPRYCLVYNDAYRRITRWAENASSPSLPGPVSGIPPLRGQPAKAGDVVAFTIADTGCGIQPDVMDRIFEPFFT
jgi:signal transduction histidine kinase